MSWPSDDLVKLTAGALVEIGAWGEVLHAAGIKYQLVGDQPTGGLATALLDPVELWVHRADAEAAEAEMAARFHNCLNDTRPSEVDPIASRPSPG